MDEASQLIVATTLTNNAADSGEMMPLLDQAKATLGDDPEQVLADAGYRSEDTFQTLEERGIDALISLGGEGKQVAVAPELEASCRMVEKLTSEEGSKRYRRWKAVVEPVIGWIKGVLGFRNFSLRGQDKLRHEWDLLCLAVNLKRFHVLQTAE